LKRFPIPEGLAPEGVFAAVMGVMLGFTLTMAVGVSLQ
jgi:hypothetical protein